MRLSKNAFANFIKEFEFFLVIRELCDLTIIIFFDWIVVLVDNDLQDEFMEVSLVKSLIAFNTQHGLLEDYKYLVCVRNFTDIGT